MTAPPSELESWQPRLAALAAGAAGGDGAHDTSHLERVWRNAQALLAGHPGADALTVMAACYLHDLVNVPKDDPERAQASRKSARLARHQLAWLGFPAALKPETIEAKIVQDADRLDSLGAVGLARMFYIAGRMGSALAHADDPLARARPLDDRAYSLDHIETKLAALPGMMQTEAGRALGAQRLAALTDLRAQFVAEWSGNPR